MVARGGPRAVIRAIAGPLLPLMTDAALAEEALRKIAQLYAIEAAVRGVSPGPSEDDLLG